MAKADDDEYDFSSDADDALIGATQQAEDEYDNSSGDEALQLLVNAESSGKRKAEDEAPSSYASKRARSYPQTSELARIVLKQTFGLEAFRLKQEQAIARLLDGGNAAVIFPTGGGKSLCYQVPAIAFPEQDTVSGARGPSDGGVTIVVSPLIALMKDQVDALQKLGVNAVAMDSSKKREEYLQTQQDLREGKVRIVYCAPERLNNEGFVASIKNVRGGVRLVAVDEAHCVSEWGHSFRPDYLKVARFVKEINAERVICLTATATPTVAKDICKAFNIDDVGTFRTPMYRSNLRLLVKTTRYVQAKYPLLFQFLKQNPGPTIVYATVQKQTEELADDLRNHGFNAVHFHAGETVAYKTNIQEQFLVSKNMIICATIAFGMGIDKPDIRNVVHFDIPSSIEGYSQQVGRAGRDGKPSNCLFFVCPDDFYIRDIFVYGDLPSIESVRKFVDDICEPNASKRVGETFEISQYSQGRDFDIRNTALSILYAQLELHFGLIRATTSKYTKYSFEAKPRYFVSAVRGNSPAAKAIFNHAQKASILHHIEVDAVARQTGVNRQEIITKLNAWSEEDIIDLRTSGVVHVYKVEKQIPATSLQRDQIASTLFAQMHKREQQDLQRSKDIIDLVTQRSCISRGLAKYFGDNSEGLPSECGHCSWCETHTPVVITPREVVSGEHAQVSKILDNVHERDDPRFLARIAFGIKSPRISASRYDKNGYFGSLKQHDFQALLRIFTAVCKNAPSTASATKTASSTSKQLHGKATTSAKTGGPRTNKNKSSGKENTTANPWPKKSLGSYATEYGNGKISQTYGKGKGRGRDF